MFEELAAGNEPRLFVSLRATQVPTPLSHTKFVESRFQKSISSQIRQPILDFGNSEGHVDGFMGELISAKRLD